MGDIKYFTNNIECSQSNYRELGKGDAKGAVAPLVFYATAPLVFCGCTYQWHTLFLTAPLYSSLFQLTCVLVVLLHVTVEIRLHHCQLCHDVHV